MAETIQLHPTHQSVLQKEAVEQFKSAYSRLPHDDDIFQKSVLSTETLFGILSSVERIGMSQEKKKRAKFMRGLEKYTTWLQNISPIVDVAVQTQAGVACPVWAPIKFILQISHDCSRVTSLVFDVLDIMVDCLPRLELYEKLQADSALQVCLLNVFTDVVEIALCALRYLRSGTIVRLSKIAIGSYDQDVKNLMSRLDQHVRTADQTATAIELLRAAEYREEMEQARREELKIQCNQWLQPADLESIHQSRLEMRYDGTCQWIMDVEAFRDWVHPDTCIKKSRMLAISGTHGCGKSILASSVFDYLQQNDRNVLLFAFSNSDGSRQDGEKLIRTLLAQLMQVLAGQKIVDIVQRLRSAGQVGFLELWHGFRNIAVLSERPIYCIIDAIDECIDFNQSSFKHIVPIVEASANLRIMFLGRPPAVQELCLVYEPSIIQMTALVLERDIDLVINGEANSSDILSAPKVREKIRCDLKTKSEGIFLWLRLMIDDLKKSSTKFEVQERLRSLPQGLEAAYCLILSRLQETLDRFDLELVQTTLAFVTTAYRPLTFQEIRHLLALYRYSVRKGRGNFEDHLLVQPPQRVISMFGGLIFMSDNFIHLAHSSLKEFLTRPCRQSANDSRQHAIIDVEQTHRSLALVCLSYSLMGSQEESQKSGPYQPDSEIDGGAEPLLKYTTMYTFHHINRSGLLPADISSSITRLLASTESMKWIERFCILLLQDPSLDSQVRELESLIQRFSQSDSFNTMFLTFENRVLDTTSKIRDISEGDVQRKELWGILIDVAREDISKIKSAGENQLHDPTYRDLHHAIPQPTRNQASQISNDASASLAETLRLAKIQKHLPGLFQLELMYKLQITLKGAKDLSDPIKLLFHLILERASCVPIYALLAIAEFYAKLEKVEEQRKVYEVAFAKLGDQEIPLKYNIQQNIARCLYKQSMMEEALVVHNKVANGRRNLLGERHKDTLNTLRGIVNLSSKLNRWSEAREACDLIFLGEDSVPEYNLEQNLCLQGGRYILFYNEVDNHSKERLRQCVLSTLKTYEDVSRQNKTLDSNRLNNIALAYYHICDYEKAVSQYELAIEAEEIERNDGRSSKNQCWNFELRRALCWSLVYLGRYNRAEDECQGILSEQQKILRSDHVSIWHTKALLNKIQIYKTI